MDSHDNITINLPKHFTVLIAFIMLILFVMPVNANWRWLSHTPAGQYNEQDWKLLKQAARDLLENGDNGDVREWQNSETGNSGKMKVLNLVNKGGKVCRKVAFSNFARQRSLYGRSVHILCKQPDGKWKIDSQ